MKAPKGEFLQLHLCSMPFETLPLPYLILAVAKQPKAAPAAAPPPAPAVVRAPSEDSENARGDDRARSVEWNNASELKSVKIVSVLVVQEGRCPAWPWRPWCCA